MAALTPNRTTEFKLPTAILGGSIAADDRTLVVGCMDGVYCVDLENKSATQIGKHDSYVSSTCILGSLNAYVTAGYDGYLQWFDSHSKESIRKIKVHNFWSWDMAVAPNQTMLASVTGQYLAGGYKYEPAAESEASVRLISPQSGELLFSLPHVPSVQAVTFSNDSQWVAAGNLMGEVRVWNCQTGELAGGFTTPDLTSWGIIKSHCYLGGVFAIRFTPDDQHILVCGMGDMRDPMAGNGRQLWQKWTWKESPAQKVDETHASESGEGLMEALAIHPAGQMFAMGGRLRGGDWNVALFDLPNGSRIGTIKSGYRVSELLFTSDGKKLVVLGGQGQPGREKDGKFPDFGRVEVYEIG